MMAGRPISSLQVVPARVTLSGALEASSTSPGTQLYVDPRSCSVLRRVDVSSEPLDIVYR